MEEKLIQEQDKSNVDDFLVYLFFIIGTGSVLVFIFNMIGALIN